MICTHQTIGGIADVIPVIHHGNKFANVFDWANSDKWVDKTDVDLWYGSLRVGMEYRMQSSDWLPVFDMLKRTDINVISMTCYGKPDYSNIGSFRWLLTPNSNIQAEVNQRIESFPKEYDVLHVRLGDDYFDGKQAPDKVLQYVRTFSDTIDKPTFILSDSPSLLESAPNILIKSGCRAVHSTPWNKQCDESVLDTLTDIKIVTGAQKVTSVVNIQQLPHGTSGFAQLPCAIYHVPYSAIQI